MDTKSMKKDELIALVDQLRAEDSNKVVTDLQDQVAAHAETISALKAQIDEAPDAATSNDVREYERIIAEQKKHIKALEKTKGNKHPIVTLSTGRYQIRGAIRAEGAIHKPEALAENLELCERLAKKGDAILEKVSE